MSTAITPKAFEKRFGDRLSELIYAVLADIEAGWNGADSYNPVVYQTYENLRRDKESRLTKLKSRFTVSDTIRQFLVTLYDKFVEELQASELEHPIQIGEIVRRAEDANDECYTASMHGLAVIYQGNFGPTLKASADVGNWFNARLTGSLTKYATNLVIVATVTEMLDSFLKSLAWVFGNQIRYDLVPLNEKAFISLFAQHGMSQLMIDILRDSLRPKPAVKPRAKKSDVAGLVGEPPAADGAAATVADDEQDIEPDDDLMDALQGV